MSEQRREKNPYDFVPLEEQPNAARKPDQARLDGLTGAITFELETLTPLCVQHSPGKPERDGRFPFAHLAGTPMLPATSLKGMLRSVHEVVTNSTLGLLGLRRGRFSESVPKAYRPGKTSGSLTPSEALFGMVGGEGAQSVGYAGRIFIDDIPIGVALIEQPVSRPQGGQPKPDHESFYFVPGPNGVTILGRKFYYHQRDYEAAISFYRQDRRMPEVKVRAVPPHARLRGTLRFVGLDRKELAALIYSLVLEPDLAHKLGYGKPLGLGSLRISITNLLVERAEGVVPARFLNYDEAPTAEDRTSEVPALRDEAKADWLSRGAAGARSYAAFAAIARWPQAENFYYPSYPFFRDERGARSKTTLWAYQGRQSHHPPGSAAQLSHQIEPAAPVGKAADATPVQSDPPERLVGRLGRNDSLGFHVATPGSEKPYQVFTGGANKALLRSVLGRLDSGAMLPVSFVLRSEGGQTLAYELQLEGDANA